MADPVLREERDGVRLSWYCDPPAGGTWFRVIREERTGTSARDIYEAETLDFPGFAAEAADG